MPKQPDCNICQQHQHAKWHEFSDGKIINPIALLERIELLPDGDAKDQIRSYVAFIAGIQWQSRKLASLRAEHAEAALTAVREQKNEEDSTLDSVCRFYSQRWFGDSQSITWRQVLDSFDGLHADLAARTKGQESMAKQIDQLEAALTAVRAPTNDNLRAAFEAGAKWVAQVDDPGRTRWSMDRGFAAFEKELAALRRLPEEGREPCLSCGGTSGHDARCASRPKEGREP